MEYYEEMRAYALGIAAGAGPRGLALLVRQGMAAWVQAWTLGAQDLPAEIAGTASGQGDRSLSAENMQAELVMVLAGIVISFGGRRGIVPGCPPEGAANAS